jgi:aarF domain-containing kinase
MGITDTIIANNYAGSNIPSPAGVRGLPLLVRRAQVFYAATTVFADYKLCQWRCNQMDSNDVRVDSLWDEAHARNARFLCNQFLNLEGLWVKMGQYLSSRADVMPDAYLKELAKCQDSLPGRPFKDVKFQVEQELKRPIYEVFESIEEKPIACASIAQVHRAKLIGGKDVVIKVQHAQIAQRILQDLQNLETIGDTLKRLDPDFDITPVIREWAKEVPKELDFRQEALSMQRVERNLEPLGPQKIQHSEHGDKVSELVIDVSFPQVINGLVTEKLLVMTYIDGFKIDDKPRLDDHQADRSSLILNVTRAFAHQIFCDGFFQADCHPGNLLVDRDTLKPVLLDFGLTKEITESTRFYFAKLLVAAAEQGTIRLYLMKRASA